MGRLSSRTGLCHDSSFLRPSRTCSIVNMVAIHIDLGAWHQSTRGEPRHDVPCDLPFGVEVVSRDKTGPASFGSLRNHAVRSENADPCRQRQRWESAIMCLSVALAASYWICQGRGDALGQSERVAPRIQTCFRRRPAKFAGSERCWAFPLHRRPGLRERELSASIALNRRQARFVVGHSDGKSTWRFSRKPVVTAT